MVVPKHSILQMTNSPDPIGCIQRGSKKKRIAEVFVRITTNFIALNILLIIAVVFTVRASFYSNRNQNLGSFCYQWQFPQCTNFTREPPKLWGYWVHFIVQAAKLVGNPQLDTSTEIWINKMIKRISYLLWSKLIKSLQKITNKQHSTHTHNTTTDELERDTQTHHRRLSYDTHKRNSHNHTNKKKTTYLSTQHTQTERT